jgi:hypothetical protein
LLNGLKLLSGLLWTVAYLLMIKRGFQDQTFGMPMLALSANLAWEFIFAFIHPHNKPQRYINLTWLTFDLVIAYQFLRYGAASGIFLVSLILSIWLILLITRRFNNPKGDYIAFGQNLLMSILFIPMLLERGNLAGQSLYIALFKLLGTAIPSVAVYLFYPPSSKIMPVLYIAIFIVDLVYVVLLYQMAFSLGINPWLRF